jgi:hypothetical protein
MKIANIAWAAGIIDGEGCLCVTRTAPGLSDRRSPHYRIILKVTMGHRETIDRLASIFKDGTRQNHVARSDRVNASYSWICQARQVERVLAIVRPYLFTKAAEAAVAERFLKVRSGLVGGRNGNPKLAAKMEREREVLYWELRKLKPRWRFYARKEKR